MLQSYMRSNMNQEMNKKDSAFIPTADCEPMTEISLLFFFFWRANDIHMIVMTAKVKTQ